MQKLFRYYMNGSDEHPALIERLRQLYIGALSALETKPLPRNTPQEQLDWYIHLDHNTVTITLYSPREEPWEICAFSMVTDRGKYCTPMFAIDEKYWGRGYGDEIIKHYLAIAGRKPLRGSQLVSNGAIVHLNDRNGWVVVSEENGVQQLFHRNGTDYPQSSYDEILRYHGVGE